MDQFDPRLLEVRSVARCNHHAIGFRDGRYLAVGNAQRSAQSLSARHDFTVQER